MIATGRKRARGKRARVLEKRRRRRGMCAKDAYTEPPVRLYDKAFLIGRDVTIQNSDPTSF